MDEEGAIVTAETDDDILTEATSDAASSEAQDTADTAGTEIQNPQSENDTVDTLLNKPKDNEDKIIDPLLSTNDDSSTANGGDLPATDDAKHVEDDDIKSNNSFEHLSPLSDDVQPSYKGFREVLGELKCNFKQKILYYSLLVNCKSSTYKQSLNVTSLSTTYNFVSYRGTHVQI